MKKQKIKIQIISIFGNILFEHEEVDNDLKKTVEKAVENGANLDGANLDRANLDGANLYRARLEGAKLYRANLDGANLDRANLDGANLDRANLDGANLYRASLYGASLYRAKNFENCHFSDLYSLKFLPQNTKLNYWKYLQNGKSPYQNAEYKVGKIYSVNEFDKDERIQCSQGLNVATLNWCLRDSANKSDIEFIEVQFKVSDIVAIPFTSDGKFRVKQFKVLRKITRDEAVDLFYKVSGLKKLK